MPESLHLTQLRDSIKAAGDAHRKVIDAAIQIGDSTNNYIAKLEAALKPFADWYTLQRDRQGNILDLDNPSLCFCNRKGDDGIKTTHLKAAAELLAKRHG